MKKYLSILIAIIITQFLFSAHENQEILDQMKKKQQAIEKIETHKRVEKEAMDRTAMIQNEKLQREIQLKNEAMEQHDKIIEWKNE